MHQALQSLSLEGKGASCGHGCCEDMAAGAGVLTKLFAVDSVIRYSIEDSILILELI